ncbi:hypothetical protein Glove_120g181 [Diversispora epigaea]|uniref:Uncharacterized protein n=1 Tax=Diversispora epigaea TaxID=1348612 RepID=A0A397J8Q5_9GLOM|nr:hypothetical protein Glove_120g181 [Diversispora epigaea]
MKAARGLKPNEKLSFNDFYYLKINNMTITYEKISDLITVLRIVRITVKEIEDNITSKGKFEELRIYLKIFTRMIILRSAFVSYIPRKML